MVKPPGPGTNPPPPSTGDIRKGYKVSNHDIMVILQGGFPGDLYNDADADVINMDAVPAGLHRAVQIAHCWGEGETILLQLSIVRGGIAHPIGTMTISELAAIGVDAVTYNQNIVNGITIKGFLMKPGDILRAQDLNAVGGDVHLTVLYVDVFL